jgi:hypothetical protein
VDAGYDIHLSLKGGIVNKQSDGHSFPILRDGLKWMIDLEELKGIKIKTSLFIVILLVLQTKYYVYMNAWGIHLWKECVLQLTLVLGKTSR